MNIEKKPAVIVVSEDAYKQNTVYRPWPEEKTKKTAGSRSSERAQQKQAAARF